MKECCLERENDLLHLIPIQILLLSLLFGVHVYLCVSGVRRERKRETEKCRRERRVRERDERKTKEKDKDETERNRKEREEEQGIKKGNKDKEEIHEIKSRKQKEDRGETGPEEEMYDKRDRFARLPGEFLPGVQRSSGLILIKSVNCNTKKKKVIVMFLLSCEVTLSGCS